ncbi:MAG: guanylate kinase [Lachnospiraceae bacterium]|nr:guanylate kinase [Lachnospiraceae bacterium]
MVKIACIMGKSASGKDHIYKALLERPELQLHKIVIYTTRPMREGECEGVEYHFTDVEGYEAYRKAGKVIESRTYETVHGPWTYYTVHDEQFKEEGNATYVILGTLDSYNAFVRYFGKEVMIPVYIEVDDGLRLERALKRERKQVQPKYAEMCRRFLADQEDFSEEKLAAAGITKRYTNNEAIEDCIEEIARMLEKNMV